MMDDLTCAQFAQNLAARQSVPGGGAAAAYAGALAVALGSMVANFTTGKPRYAAFEEDIQRTLTDGERIRARLVSLVEEDAQAFEPLSVAYGIPKDDPNRAATLEAATKGAVEAPLEMMRQISDAITILEELSEKGSRMLLSDVGCGAALAAGALRSAALNVFVNTKALQDRAFAEAINTEAEALLQNAPRADALFTRIADTYR